MMLTKLIIRKGAPLLAPRKANKHQEYHPPISKFDHQTFKKKIERKRENVRERESEGEFRLSIASV